eukprot:8007037-Heterocapsa_arctica.AAC.1
MVGAQRNDMNKWQKIEVIKYLENNPERKADAMQDFEKSLMEDKGRVLPSALEAMSGRIYDAVVGNVAAKNRGWLPLERMGNQCYGWYPWG